VIQRYDLENDMGGGAMKKNSYGDWVDYDDHIAAIETLRAALEAVAAGIWRNKAMNACGLAGGSAVVHLVEAALQKGAPDA
jgi:hypothetical protein